MNIIKHSWQIIEPTGYTIDDIYKSIELAGRCSHKSEDKITETSAKEFVGRMLNMKHLATCEFGTIYLYYKVNKPSTMTKEIIDFYKNNQYSKVNCINNYSNTYSECGMGRLYDIEYSEYFITTNLRVCIENNRQEYLTNALCEPTEYHHKRYTVKYICDRAIANEIVRHRKFSFLQESTRYVCSSSSVPLKEFNCDCTEDIIKAYKQGFSMKNISDNSSYKEWDIRKILIENNVEIRGLNNKGNRIEDYFSIIDSSEKAYLLGLIQTDGNIRISSRNAAVTITQHKDYAWYIEDLLLNFSDYIGNTKDRDCRQLLIGSKSIVNDLISLGIVPNKVKEQTDDDINKLWDSIPEEFKGDFIRGCIDGDGYVTFFTQKRGVNESCNIGFCSVKEILIDKIIDFLYNKFNYKCGKGKDGNIYKLWITDIKKAIEIGDYLYTNFKYPFGHPKKASAWIKRIKKQYPIAKYKDSKFQVIMPSWLNESCPESIFTYIRGLDNCENAYTKLRMSGWKAEQARDILPLALKTELYMCGYAEDWEKFFELRCAPNVHPQCKELTIPLRDEFIKRGYIIQK